MNRTPQRALLRSTYCAFLFGFAICAWASSSRRTLASSVGALAPNPGPAMGAMLAAPPESEAEENKAENRELIYKTINFIILAGGLAYLLRKPLSEFFTQRSAGIRAGLEEGRKALEASQTRLSVVEEKLRRLEEEIAAFKDSATREMEVERQRRREATAAEVEKMLEAARARMETTTRATKLELRYFVADEALKQAELMIQGRLDDATRERLVSQFVTKLGTKQNMN